IDTEKRQIKLSMKQLIPTSIDEYLAEHKSGDTVSGRVVQESDGRATVELGEGIFGIGRANSAVEVKTEKEMAVATAAVDLSALTSLLQARWKGNAPAPAAKPEPLHAGQVRS